MTTIAPGARMASAPRTYPPRAAVVSWIFFDWAAQPYFTLITTFVFAPYFATSIAPDPATGQSLWGFAMAAAGMAIALLSPVLGAIADASGRRKPWIAAFGALLVVASCTLWIGKPGNHAIIPPLLIAVALASVGAEFATVFNNAMMPTLVPPERIGRLSGTGWATGYIGGIVSLIIVLGFFAANPETGRTLLGFTPLFGLDPATHEGDRAAGPLTGLWFIIFVTPMFLFTPDYPAKRPLREALHEGLADLKQSLKDLPQQKSLAAFLLANMIYTDGLVSLFAFGGIYAAGTFGWHTIQIGTFGILLAIAGTFGAWLGGKLDDFLGPKRVIAGSLLILLLAVAAILLVDKDSVLFVKVAPPVPGGPMFARCRGACLYRAGLPDRCGRRPASGGVTHAADPPRAEGSHRAVFWSVRADREGDVLHRAAADRRDYRGNREPEGRHGRAGRVFRHRVRAADAGARRVNSLRRPVARMERSVIRGSRREVAKPGFRFAPSGLRLW